MFIYTISRCILNVGVMLTIFFTLSFEIVFVSSVPLSSLTAKEFNISSQTDFANYTLALNQHFVKTHNSDHILLRLAVLFVGIVLVFAMLICVCTMYWCVCWAVQWSSSSTPSTHRTISSWNRLMSRSRFRSNRKQPSKDVSSHDLPPAYEVILAHQEDEAVARAVVVRNTDMYEEAPPPYVEVQTNMGHHDT